MLDQIDDGELGLVIRLALSGLSYRQLTMVEGHTVPGKKFETIDTAT